MINFSDPQTRYLIDYANLKHGLVKYQKDFLDKKKLNSFLKNKFYGFPLILPLGIKYFDYSNVNSKFKITKKEAKKYIFECKSDDYVGLKIFFKYGNIFCTGAVLKEKYKNDLKYIISYNKKLKSLISKYNKNFKTTSFQTRNIPHLGHELILQKLIRKNNILFVNPIIGLKKKGDINNIVLKKVFNYLKKIDIYKRKMIYAPVIFNMNYAGPREALHHTYLREFLGFDEFTVGRDHAGAEKNYMPLAAKKFVRKNKKRFKISVFYHDGAYFCKTCKKIVLKGECKHNNLEGISGTEFRNNLKKKSLFKYARKSLQKHINKFDIKLFN